MQSLFQSGSYQPLRIRGDRQNNLIGFTRHNQNQAALILVSRFFCGLDVVKRLPVGGGVWNGTQIDLPDEIPRAIVRDVFTNKTIDLSQNGNRETIAVSELLNEFPISFMVTEGPA